ncbi:GAF domain-containing protein [Flavobacteriales bacterium]|jgi:L-methionine (R)-S-oxide reductase|nr:GAF domain-containing protein [Flavobacteriales bacterium]MDC6465018.1 GAF domain-containing protein [bacterium]
MRDYQLLTNQVKSFLEGEDNLIANLANTCALIKTSFDDWWVGFYLVENDELVLGPFQGPVACTRIKKGKGVCGSAFEKRQSMVVANVHEFEGHIACSAESNSEIVVPVLVDGNVVAILDIDSKEFDQFNEMDQKGLEGICELIALKWS